MKICLNLNLVNKNIIIKLKRKYVRSRTRRFDIKQ